MIDQMKSEIVYHNLTVYVSHALKTQFAESAHNFSQAMFEKDQSSSYYVKNRSADKRKVYQDIELSKFSEWIVAYGLSKMGFPSVHPGEEIRDNFQKGWEPDLTFDDDSGIPDMHLKNTPSRYRKQLSWTFQHSNKSGGGGRDPLFDNPDSNDIVVLTYCSHIGNCGKIMWSAPWRLLYPLLKDPMFPKYQGIKKCIYEDDLCAIRQKLLKSISSND